MQKGSNILVVSLVVLSLITLSAVGYLFIQNKKLQESIKDIAPRPYLQETAAPYVSVSPTPESESGSTVIIFESEASIPQTHKDQVTKRIIEPYLDYYKDLQGTSDYVVSLKIRFNTNENKATYPYLADAIHKDGSNAGFVIEKDVNGIKWWYPECLNGCNLSSSFKAKYPEIAKIVD